MDPAVLGSQLLEGTVQQLPFIGAVGVAIILGLVVLAFLWKLLIILFKVGAFVAVAVLLMHFSSGYVSQVRDRLMPGDAWSAIENITSAVRNELRTVDVRFEIRRIKR
jgi:hypothetical protein